MKKKKSSLFYQLFLFLMFQTFGLPAYGQSTKDCSVVYDQLEEMPKYKEGGQDLSKYIFNELTPILSECKKGKEPPITSMYISLLIQKDGQVGEVEFKRIEASETCKSKIREKLMKMQGWAAGKKDGVTVCCRFFLPVKCIKWE